MIAALLCIVVSLSLKCWLLHLNLEKALREAENSDRLFRQAWRDWTKERARLEKALADRNLWRNKWKSGSFEMDAATMAKLAEQEAE